MTWCKKCKVFGIRLLLVKNYRISRHQVDLESEVDDTLNFTENWNSIKNKYLKPKKREEEEWD